MTYWKPAAITVALAFLYAGVLRKLGFDWYSDENYSHGLLVPFVIGFIVWTQFGELKKEVAPPSVWIGAAMIGLALAMLLGGTLGAELFTQRISLVLMIAGIIAWYFGTRILQALATPFVLLLLSIPIPQIIFNKIAFPLQIWASQAAVWGIRLLEVPSVRNGNVIEILPLGATQSIALEVVEACSGIRSLMTQMTLGLVLAYFTREDGPRGGSRLAFLKDFDFWRTVILIVSAIPIAVLTNAARVTGTGVLTYYYGKQATDGTWHEVSGWLVYLVALAILAAVNALLKKLVKTGPAASAANPDSAQNVASSAPTAVLILALATGGVVINWFEHRGEVSVARQPLSELSSTLGEWQQKGKEIRFDEATESVLRTTDYTMRDYEFPNGRRANVYIGYYASQRTGATYHSPQNCLPGSGWEMKKPAEFEIVTPAGRKITVNRYLVENGSYREIMIYWYQGRGRTFASEYLDKIGTVWDSVIRHRSDGAMIRVMTSAGNNEVEAADAAADLSGNLADQLDRHVPD